LGIVFFIQQRLRAGHYKIPAQQQAVNVSGNFMDDLNEQVRLHSAGATVRHKSTFADLPSYRNAEELSQDFIDT